MLMSMCATSANALACFDRSPTNKDPKNPYPPIKVRELTKKENEYLKMTSKSLDGDWIGAGEYESCKGTTYDTPDKEITQYSLRARLSVDHRGSFTIRVELKAVREGGIGKTFRSTSPAKNCVQGITPTAAKWS